jgi:tetratricopeptide (TPR) repeat protein
VSREGWHAVSVTVPKYPKYEIGAKPGYAIETRLPGPAAPAPAARPAVIEGLVDSYDRDSPAAFADALRRVADYPEVIDAFDKGGNPWPDKPKREAAFVLELAQAALASGQRGAPLSVRNLLDKHRLLVRDPLGPESFEKFWLWAAAAILESVNEPAVAQAFVTSALARFPDEPRLLLAKAFLLDRRQPFASGPPGQNNIFIPRFSAGVPTETRISRTTGLAADHVREVSAAYDAAMSSPEIGAEARIRKSLLLLRAGRPQEALALLDSSGALTADSGLRYFRDLFRGRVLTSLGSAEEAETAYRAALALAPQAQSPRVALMALALHRGDRAAAATLAEEIQGAPAVAWDPWWNYWQGDYRLVANALGRLRVQTR